jgi:lysozyme
MSITNKKYLVFVVSFLFAMISLLFSFYYGYLRFNYPSQSRFPVQGLDVSHYQGHIDWDKVRGSKLTFVFIKATEGAHFVDPEFRYNWDNAQKSGLYVGAYHFFTLNKTGKEQAINFSNCVPYRTNSLPPVIDLEFMGNSKNHFSRLQLLKELTDFITVIETKYHKKPILYSTYEFYEFYLIGNFQDYPIWIRDIYTEPGLIDARPWTFWQYTNRGKIDGIQNFVDLNAFNGHMSDFMKLITGHDH